MYKEEGGPAISNRQATDFRLISHSPKIKTQNKFTFDRASVRSGS
jgi:hypothetical protein